MILALILVILVLILVILVLILVILALTLVTLVLILVILALVLVILVLALVILDQKRRRTSMLRCLLLPLESRRPNPGFPVRVAAHLQHGIHLPSSEGTQVFLFWEREGMVVKVIQSLLLRSSPLLLGKGRGGGHLLSWDKVRVSVMVMQSLLKALLLFWEREWGWWSWSYRAFFAEPLLLPWEREGVVVKVIQSRILRNSPPLLGKRRGGGHGHTEPSS